MGGGGGGARTDGRSDACDVITKPKFLALMGLPKSLSYGSPCVQRKHDPKNCTENWFVFLFLLSMLGFFLVFFFSLLFLLLFLLLLLLLLLCDKKTFPCT